MSTFTDSLARLISNNGLKIIRPLDLSRVGIILWSLGPAPEELWELYSISNDLTCEWFW